MSLHNQVLLRIAPFLVVLAGWINDHAIRHNIDRASLFMIVGADTSPIYYWSLYDIAGKWIVGLTAAYFTFNLHHHHNNHQNRPLSARRSWLIVWTIIWLMLAFESYARFTGLFNWMLGSWNSLLVLFPHRAFNGTRLVTAYQLLVWSLRPMIAFGAAYALFNLISLLLHPANLKRKPAS